MQNSRQRTAAAAANAHPVERIPWTPHNVTVHLAQQQWGDWYVYLGKGAEGVPATDAEVALWKELQAAREVIGRLKNE